VGTTVSYDALLRNGTVIDPATSLHAVRDVASAAGRVVAIDSNLSGEAREVIDATGMLVVPGLIDLHAHVFPYVTNLGVDVDSTCAAKGVTTVVDAGSAGANTFPGFRRYVIGQVQTRTLGFLNISAMGLIDDAIGELHDIRWAMVDRAVEVARANPDTIVGIKVRLSEMIVGQNGTAALDRSLEAADQVGLPIMVHIGGLERPLGAILNRMRAGDILTHCFTGWGPGIIGEDGHVIPEAIAARQRGVLFDIGHGQGSFSFGVAARALADGFLPDTISTDLHTGNIDGPVFDLATTLSKFLSLGLSLDEVISCATLAPAHALRRQEQFGSLQPGMCADIAVLRIEEGPVTLVDSAGVSRTAPSRLVPVATLRAGRIHHA
jgi:dihydroorotase